MSGSNPGPVPPIAPDSSVAGFIQPSSTSSDYLEDNALDNFFQQMVAGITGLPPTLVLPRWQPEPVNLPAYGTNWAAVGVVDSDLVDGWSYETHDPANTGTDQTATWEYLTLLCSFYGPNAGQYDGLLRDGLFLNQNQETLLLNGIGLIEWRNRAIVPTLIKERWLRRIDRRVRFMREIDRVYNIRNILSVPLTVSAQPTSGSAPNQTDTWTITPPGVT